MFPRPDPLSGGARGPGVGEGAAPQPAPEIAPTPPGSLHPDAAGRDLFGRLRISGPDFREGAHGRVDDEGLVLVRIVAAKIGRAPFDDQPPAALAAARVRKAE